MLLMNGLQWGTEPSYKPIDLILKWSLSAVPTGGEQKKSGHPK